eukprot:gnl/Spiro4/16271_TR8739_c0_g1_i1.p1 gnl/Spiro4/16271_TR8739_c0_g1~~gnl/Spiro4/16271_TR8739_c0_g1_i1.p1  ORF type:complete len:388 (-),score=50.62 gnl/Spiro4/16271_TR8739_c0_g1_i1:25-1188(-)
MPGRDKPSWATATTTGTSDTTATPARSVIVPPATTSTTHTPFIAAATSFTTPTTPITTTSAPPPASVTLPRCETPPPPANQQNRSGHKNQNIPDGYNSDDERSPLKHVQTFQEDEEQFMQRLRARGFEIKRMGEDGNCMFRAVSDQVFGDQEMYGDVRKLCCDFMAAEKDHYSSYVTEDFAEYVSRKRQDRVYGNHVELQVLAELYNRPIHVFSPGTSEALNIFHGAYTTDNPPMFLSYHGHNHYNSLLDVANPSAGIGLGLPQLKTFKQADSELISNVMAQSADTLVEQELMEQSKATSEWEETSREFEAAQLTQALERSTSDLDNADILNQVLLESSRDQPEDSIPPPVVLSLCEAGFPLASALRAYSFVGDNFDDCVCFLLSGR